MIFFDDFQHNSGDSRKTMYYVLCQTLWLNKFEKKEKNVKETTI